LEQSDKKEDAAGAVLPGVVLPYAPRAALPLEDAAPPAVAHPLDLDSIDKEPAAPAASRPQEPAAEKPHQSATEPAAPVTEADPDLERLEASLQWIQREGSGSHLPRAAPLPPVSGLRPLGAEGARARSDQFINGVRVPPSLAPERLRPPPMRERRDNLRGPIRVVLAAVIAAPIAYYFSVGGFSSHTEGGRESGLSSLATRLVASTEFPIPKDQLPPGEAEDYNTMVSSRNKLVAVAPAPAAKAPVAIETPAPAPAAAPVPPSPAVEQPAPAPKVMREMDPSSIKLLMQQGEQFLASGDVITARTVFQRAAEAGNAAAALALGATFDPEVLAKMGARGVSADIEKARMWYERAKEYGSADAPRRLEALANR
jgi:hypothetical protein